MHVPAAVAKFTNGFHQDVFIVESGLDGAIEHALMFISLEEKRVVEKFFLDLLKPDRDPAEVKAIWDALPKGIRIENDDQIVEFLQYIRNYLSANM